MKFTPIEEVVASCYSILSGAKREHRPLIRFWIWLAEKQIGCAKPNQETCEEDVADLAVRKPSNHLKTIDLSLVDNSGRDVVYNYRGYKKRIHDKSPSNNPQSIDVYEDEFSIFLSSNAESIDRVKIRYWAYPIDENCDPLIPEEHIYAIMQFVRMMFYIKEDRAESKIGEAKTEWKIQAAKARASNKMPDIPEAREIMKGWMSMLPKQSVLDYETY